MNTPLYNTDILLKLLPRLRTHRSNIDSEHSQQEERELSELMSNMFQNFELSAASLARSRRRTHALITHVEVAFEQWRKLNGDTHSHRRRRRILIGFYNLGFGERRLTAAELAERERISEERVKKELGHARGELSALFFGKDGIVRYLLGQDGKRPSLGKPSAPTSRAEAR